MINESLHIGEWIYATLSQIDNLSVFPVIATEENEGNYCVYWRTSMTSSNTKDGINGDTLTINLNIYSQDYEESVSLMTTARKMLCKGGRYNGMRICNFQIITGSEDWAENFFIQNITFTIDITN